MLKIEIDKEELIDLYVKQGMRTKDIAKIYNVTPKTIRFRLHEHGIEVRQSCIENRKNTFNENYFDTIDTQAKAYILGFICADGWVATNRCGNPNLVGLMIQERDVEILEFIKDELNVKGCKPSTGNGAIGLNLCSVKMAKTLNSYGVVPNKSLTLDIEEVINKAQISKHLIPSFVLGYYDGDGGIYSTLGRNKKTLQWSCGFTGTMETCKYLQKFFNDGHIVDEKAKSGRVFTFKMSGRNRVVEGLEKLYGQHETFCFYRKYQKFLVAKSPTG